MTREFSSFLLPLGRCHPSPDLRGVIVDQADRRIAVLGVRLHVPDHDELVESGATPGGRRFVPRDLVM